ncbi:glycine zipper 2TM domain-containing protein [Brucella anthropi]
MRMILYSVLTMAVIGATASGCTTDERRTAGYGVGGAAIGGLAGAAIGGDTRGALTGAAIGAAAGTLVGVAQTRNGIQYCRYRDQHGRIYEARCR